MDDDPATLTITGPEMSVTEIAPLVMRATGMVGAWRCRITATLAPSFQAFDFFTVPVTPRPLADWTRESIQAAIKAGLANDPSLNRGYQQLVSKVMFRATYDERQPCAGDGCPHLACFDYQRVRSEADG